MRSLLTILALWCAGRGATARSGNISMAYEALVGAHPAEAGVRTRIAMMRPTTEKDQGRVGWRPGVCGRSRNMPQR